MKFLLHVKVMTATKNYKGVNAQVVFFAETRKKSPPSCIDTFIFCRDLALPTLAKGSNSQNPLDCRFSSVRQKPFANAALQNLGGFHPPIPLSLSCQSQKKSFFLQKMPFIGFSGRKELKPQDRQSHLQNRHLSINVI